MSDLAEIKKRLPRLKPADLVQVRKVLDALSGAPGEDVSVRDKDWLLEGFVAELRRRGLWMRRYAMPRELLPTAYAKKAAAVRQHLMQGCNGSLRYVEQLALAQLAASALADYLIKCKAPVTPHTLLNNLHNVPLALEEAFPDYWGNKLLGRCIALQE